MENKMMKWQEEFLLYLNYKSTFIFEGEILDKQPLNLEDDGYMLYSLNDFLYYNLKKQGYQAVIFFNHVDGFFNKHAKDEIAIFNKIIKKGKKISTESEEDVTKKDRKEQNSKFSYATDYIRFAMENNETAIAIVLDMASRYVTVATQLDKDEHYLYSELFIASTNAKKIQGEKGPLTNCTILIADKINDIPTWFYLNNPCVKSLYITLPNKDSRTRYFNETKSLFYGYDSFSKLSEEEQVRLTRKFVDLTNGFKNIELTALRDLMKNEKISLMNIEDAITLYKHGIKDNPWNNSELKERLKSLEKDLTRDVKGQKHAIKHVSDIVIRSIYGLSGVQHSNKFSKPKGVMFFAGPTGTGKTELAKSLTRWLFGTEDAFIRFDMSEYSQSHSDQRLLGAPPGYVGYEAGGQLTNAVKAKPFSILLFDEIEKADKTILDKFLQILEDGRMTDSKGETVYFSNTLIIFTSNLGVSKLNRHTGERVPIIDYKDDNSDYEVFKEKVMSGVDGFFINEAGRPEIKNRIGDNFVIFEFINEEVGRLIANSQLDKIVNNLKRDNNITLQLTEPAKEKLYELVFKRLDQGGRGVGNMMEKHLINPLARIFPTLYKLNFITIEITDFVNKSGETILEYSVK